MNDLTSEWTDFFVTAGGAAAALTGLLFVAVALRPREIRHSPLMVGRARSAFYAFATVLIAALIALAGTSAKWVGLLVTLVAIGGFALSLPFTVAAMRARTLNYRRAAVYHAGLLLVAAGWIGIGVVLLAARQRTWGLACLVGSVTCIGGYVVLALTVAF